MSTNKNALKKSPAQEGLDELMDLGTEETTQVSQAATLPTKTSEYSEEETTTVDGADEELESLGAGARVETFFIHKAYPKMKDNQVVICEEDTFDGRYEGSFTSGKFKSRTHKITVTSGPYAGKVIGLPTAGILDKRFQFVPNGTRAVVRYTGKGIITSGEWKGSESYSYDVAIPKSIKAKIEAGQLEANYELKKLK